jgi:hypothetical protein
LKTLNQKKISLPKIAVLATGLTAAILVATMGPTTAQLIFSGTSRDCGAATRHRRTASHDNSFNEGICG